MSESIRDQLLLGTYSLVKRSGLLESDIGRDIFRKAYFLYKQYIEDDLGALIHFRPELVRGGNVLDIGANIGFTATVLARAIEPGYLVYAFEPEPSNFGMLQEIASRSEYRGKINALQCAVGAEGGSVEFWQNKGHHADHRVITEQFRSSGATGIKVPMTSIDEFLSRNPGPVSFVKVDVQGFEFPVCQGMARTIEANPDLTIFLEYAPAAFRILGFEPSDMINFLTNRGFQIYRIGPKGRLSPGLPAQVDDTDYMDLIFSRRALEFGKPK